MRANYNDTKMIMGMEAEKQIMDELIALGYRVTRGEAYDLYAEKGDDKRIYEIKIGTKIDRRQYDRLQKIAREKDAELYVVNMKLNDPKSIEYEEISRILFEDLESDFPDELDLLSTHTRIDSVDDVNLYSIDIKPGKMILSGDAHIAVTLQWGSDREIEDDDRMEQSFYFEFEIVLDREDKIINRAYNFNLNDYYEE